MVASASCSAASSAPIAGKRAEILGGCCSIGIGTAILSSTSARSRSGPGRPTARPFVAPRLQPRRAGADIRAVPDPDIAMARAFLLIRLTLVLVGASPQRRRRTAAPAPTRTEVGQHLQHGHRSAGDGRAPVARLGRREPGAQGGGQQPVPRAAPAERELASLRPLEAPAPQPRDGEA
jgi:hypothetical protein